LDYGVASPGDVITETPSNYFPPGLYEQDALIGSNQLVPYTNDLGYGAGGTQSNDTMQGRGAHGAILINFDGTSVVQPIGNATQTPAFVDGSKLSLFQAPISYISDTRVLPFTAYTDSIQLSPFSNYNWVWYKSYLCLTGSSLDYNTMRATTQEAQPPFRKYPGLPAIVYTAIEEQVHNVSSFFNGVTSASVPIIQGLQVSFELFNQYFINTPYTDTRYVTYTEVYCLLDYLRQTSNLLNPHVDSITSPLDRVFGGVPGHGYWANPFLTNVSYVGFDTGTSLETPSLLSTISGSSDSVTAFYGLALEQNLSSGVYTMKNIMAYKPTLADASNHGSNWLKVTQLPVFS
jgi:hypothetical protein